MRARWRTMVILVLLVGVAGGVVLTAIAGARRSSTAYERFREETLAADLDVAFTEDPAIGIEEAKKAIAALPQVEVLTQTAFPFIVPAGSGFYPYLDFLAIVGLDDRFSSSIDRARLLEGRLPEPGRPEEIGMLGEYANQIHVNVGDSVAFESFAPEQFEALFSTGDAGPPAGPRLTLTVTGTFDAPNFLSESTGAFQPKVFLSPAFVEAYGDRVAIYPGGVTVRLRNGSADVAATSAAVRRLFGDSAVELTPAEEIDSKIESSIDVIVTALMLCALAAGIAGGVAVAQALVRHLRRDVAESRLLAALGMTPKERVIGDVTATLPVAVGGALLAVAAAVAASPLMPVGVARRAEPEVGLSVDGWVVAVGFAAIAGGVAAITALASIAIGRRTRVARAGTTARISRRSGRCIGRRSRPRCRSAWAWWSSRVLTPDGRFGRPLPASSSR